MVSRERVGRYLSSHMTEADKIGLVPSLPPEYTVKDSVLKIDLCTTINSVQLFHKFLAVASMAAAPAWLPETCAPAGRAAHGSGLPVHRAVVSSCIKT